MPTLRSAMPCGRNPNARRLNARSAPPRGHALVAIRGGTGTAARRRSSILELELGFGLRSIWTPVDHGIKQVPIHVHTRRLAKDYGKMYKQSDRIVIEPGYCSLIDAFGAGWYRYLLACIGLRAARGCG